MANPERCRADNSREIPRYSVRYVTTKYLGTCYQVALVSSGAVLKG